VSLLEESRKKKFVSSFLYPSVTDELINLQIANVVVISPVLLLFIDFLKHLIVASSRLNFINKVKLAILVHSIEIPQIWKIHQLKQNEIFKQITTRSSGLSEAVYSVIEEVKRDCCCSSHST